LELWDSKVKAIPRARIICTALLFPRYSVKKTQIKSKMRKIFSLREPEILNKMIHLLFVVALGYFQRLNVLKHHMEVINPTGKHLKNYSSNCHLLWLNDNVFILRDGFGCENTNLDLVRSYFQVNISISDCSFSRSILFSGHGGVIYVSGASYSMNVYSSMFYNCVCSQNGGAIYFSSSNIYIRMICAKKFSCGASYSYQFAFFKVSQINQLDYLSVSYCYYATNERYTFYVQNGNQSVKNINSSMNNAYKGSGILIDSPSSFTSSHCTFSNNKVSHSVCIWFYSASGTMSYANIIHNNSPSNGVVVVEGIGSIMMTLCIFKNNENYLYCIWQGSLEVSHSFIDHSSSLSTRTPVSTSTNISFTAEMTYQIQFFNSYHCHADIPIPQRTYDQSPISTLEKTPMNTIEETLLNTLEYTPMNTLEYTPMNTLEYTPMNTLEYTPMNTLEYTPMNTLEYTPMNTLEYTPMNTLEYTPMDTLEKTPMKTLEETILNNNSGTISLRLVFVSLSIIVLIILLIYAIGLVLNYIQKSSETSSEKPDEVISATI